MPYPQLDRTKLQFFPLSQRKNKVYIERDHISVDAKPRAISPGVDRLLNEIADRLRQARQAQKPRMLTFGAHCIKNGLAPVLIKLIETGWVSHLATNGAGIIHDWEFAFQGSSSEDVRVGVDQGRFGLWEETGRYINLAIALGAYDGLGYGESVGRFIEEEGLAIPSENELKEMAQQGLRTDAEKAAAACDVLQLTRLFQLEPGRLTVPHPCKSYSVQAAAYRLVVPFTGHPMIGHDIIYCHPTNHCAALGRAAQRDFLAFARNVADLDGGVYLSVGSAVMSPMVFEKSMSMAQNLAIQKGRHLDNHYIVIVDLQESRWDWAKGEPPEDSPEYYLRYCKSFSRMGGTMRYVGADNRDFLLALLQRLEGIEPQENWKPRGQLK